MPDAKIITYGELISATTDVIPDNQSVALDIESTDAKDYITIDTTDGSEKLVFNSGQPGIAAQVGVSSRGPRISGTTGATYPAYNFIGDEDTGMTHLGTSNNDQLSLVAGGVEGIRIQETGGAITTTITDMVGIGDTAPASMISIKGNLGTALTGTVSTSGADATVTGAGGSSFLTELDIGAAISWTNNADGTETHTVTAIASASSLTVDATPGASTAKQAYTDPVLLQVNTGDDQTAFAVKPGGRIEVGDTSPANNFNTILGDSTAAGALTTGTRNAVFGRAAGSSLTTGAGNVILGDASGAFVTTGSYNTIIGREARGPTGGGSYNTMIGNDTGNNAVANDHAVCLGVKAGMMGTRDISQAYGDQNVLLGNYAIPAAAGDANTIAIGYDCTGNGANTATIGNDSAISLHTPPVYSTSNATTAISGLIASISGTTVEGDGSANFTSDLKVGSSIRWLSDAVNISDFSEATPCSVTSSSHGRQTGDIVKFSSVGGVTGINGDYYWTITVSDANTFTLDDTTPSSFGGSGYTSGGTFQSRESHIVASITDADTLVVRTTPRGTATNQPVYTDPVLLKISSCAADIIVVDKYSRVGVGTAAPSALFHVQDGDAAIVTNNADDATAKSLIFKRSKSNTDGTAVVVADDDILGNIEFQGAEDGDSWATGAKIFARVNGTPGDGDMPTELVFATSKDGTETPLEYMRLSNAGTLQILNYEDENRFSFSSDASNGTLQMDSGSGSTRTIITSGTTGSYLRYSALNLGQNNTTSEGQIHVVVGTSDTAGGGAISVVDDRNCIKCEMDDTTNNPIVVDLANTGSGDAIKYAGADNKFFHVKHDGDCENTNNSYGGVSDRRLKENITDATSKLSDINKLQVRNFNFIGDDLKQIGLVADEVAEVFPGLVKSSDARTYSRTESVGDNGELQVEKELIGGLEDQKSVKYSVLVPMLIKAVQELTARIEELENDGN